MSEVITELQGSVLRITLNRPDRRNAMNESVIENLSHAIKDANSNSAVHVIVLTGAGEKAFCAGADLQSGTSFEFDYSTPSLAFADLLRTAHASTVPLIARVNGACMAGGMGLLSMCDMAVAADHAIFGLPEVKVGVFPMQVLSVLQHIVPMRALYELCLTGEPITASQALGIGLVNHVVPAAELDAKVNWLEGRLTDKSPAAIRRGRYVMRRIQNMAFEESISFTESQIGVVAMTQDAKEGLLAFREKRKPVWTGK